jgi:putative ABC transport system permease protein
MIQSIQMLARRFSKDSLFSFINLTNLGVGFAAFILLSQFIDSYLSWDKGNSNYDRIYRVQLFMDEKENTTTHSSSVSAAFSRHELTKLPEIEKIALIHDVGDNNKDGTFLSMDKKNQFLTRYGYYADQSVFDILTFRFTEGAKEGALEKPYSIVLSKSVADKLFPEGKVIGKQVYGENKAILTVTGVYEDLSARSSWRPAYLIPMNTFTALTGWRDYEDDYWAYSFYTYVLLKPNTNPSSVDAKIYDALKNYRHEHHPYLRPLSKLYLNPYFQNDMILVLGLYSFIALLILILSAVNFINLQTVNASNRFREIGIKKTVGFTKKKLWSQFMIESMAMTLISASFGLIVAQLSIPFFNRMIGVEMLTNIFSDWKLIFIIVLSTILTGILSGIHPAFVISSFNPISALKQKFVEEEVNGLSLKKILVTVQFSISIFLLLVSFIIYRQTNYMLKKDMGFDNEHVLFANIVTLKSGSFEAVRQNLLRHPEIADACESDYIPFILPGGDDLNWDGGQPDQKVFVRTSNISYGFVSTFNLKMMSGRNFSREFPADRQKCLINETAARVFGWKESLGKHIKVYNKDLEVIGVIRDYVEFSVHNPLEPHLFMLLPDSIISDRVYSVRFIPGTEKKAMDIVRKEFEESFPDDAFEFKNIQSRIQSENAYLHWKRFSRMCGFIALLSILISSIGLFGLILFVSRRKMKEIAVRKILGFSFVNLYMTLSSGFIKLLFVSILLAWPAAYYVYKFLPGANKYGIQIWEFLLGTLIVLLVAMVTISFQIIKAVRTKPVEVLKDE